MTRSTSPRSVKVTPKTGDEQASNGTPPTDTDSAVIFVESPESARETTGWTLQFASGGVHHVRVKGGRGRISYSSPRAGSSGGEVRVYRNESTKVYDALFTGVTHIVSDRVEVIPTKWGSGIDIDPKLNGSPPKKAAPEKEKELTVSFNSSGIWSSGDPLLKPSKARPKLNPEDF